MLRIAVRQSDKRKVHEVNDIAPLCVHSCGARSSVSDTGSHIVVIRRSLYIRDKSGAHARDGTSSLDCVL